VSAAVTRANTVEGARPAPPPAHGDLRLLVFNLATDADHPILGFTSVWIAALAARVRSVDVLTMTAGRLALPANVRVHSVGRERGYGEPRRALEFYRHLLRLTRGGRIDGCFSHMMPLFSAMAAPVLRARGIPLVTWFAHPSLTPTLKLAHVGSTRMVTSLPSAYPYRHDKLTVIGQGIDTALFVPGEGRRDPVPTILCAGRLSPVKDHATLIRAAALLRERGAPPFRVVILGQPAGSDTGYLDGLRAEVRARGLDDGVAFHPAVPMHELVPWYQGCTVHVNLTPAGFGDKVAWEAMSCGAPSLVANEEFRETLGRHAPELLFRYRDPESLAERLAAVLERTPAERAEIGAYLREQVVRLHSLDQLSGRIVGILEEARAGRRPGAAA
jgi:glycosyltransferase involved in cell wall biosynthesis